jgi:hypothetical protein
MSTRDYESEAYAIIAGDVEPMAGGMRRMLPTPQKEHLEALAEVLRRTINERDVAKEALRDMLHHFGSIVPTDMQAESVETARKALA